MDDNISLRSEPESSDSESMLSNGSFVETEDSYADDARSDTSATLLDHHIFVCKNVLITLPRIAKKAQAAFAAIKQTVDVVANEIAKYGHFPVSEITTITSDDRSELEMLETAIEKTSEPPLAWLLDESKDAKNTPELQQLALDVHQQQSIKFRERTQAFVENGIIRDGVDARAIISELSSFVEL